MLYCVCSMQRCIATNHKSLAWGLSFSGVEVIIVRLIAKMQTTKMGAKLLNLRCQNCVSFFKLFTCSIAHHMSFYIVPHVHHQLSKIVANKYEENIVFMERKVRFDICYVVSHMKRRVWHIPLD